MEWLSRWCGDNNLSPYTTKTKEVIVDYRKNKTDIQPLYINGDYVERVSTFWFLGIHMEEDLIWGTNIMELIKKAQQRLYFLRLLRKNHLSQKLLVAFYYSSIESVLTYGVGVVRQRHNSREEGASEGHHHSPENH